MEQATLHTSRKKLISVGLQIMSATPGDDDIAFTHSVRCQVGLPRSRFDGDRFVRQSGDAWV